MPITEVYRRVAAGVARRQALEDVAVRFGFAHWRRRRRRRRWRLANQFILTAEARSVVVLASHAAAPASTPRIAAAPAIKSIFTLAAAGIDAVDGIVVNVGVEVIITAREAKWILGGPAPDFRRVIAHSKARQSGIGILHARRKSDSRGPRRGIEEHIAKLIKIDSLDYVPRRVHN